MKFAIDIDDDIIKRKLIEELSSNGNLVIDCKQEENLNVLESHHRKVMLTNTNNAEIFFRFIEEKGDIDKVELFGDEDILSKIMSLDFESIADDLELEQISLKNGRELYLIKNMECTSVIIRLISKTEKDRKKVYNMIYRLLNETCK